MSRNEYDINLRSLVGDYSQDFLQWLLDDTVRVEEIVNPVFTSRERRADFVARDDFSQRSPRLASLGPSDGTAE
ncbi:hypothetical protein [Synechococcus sp. PCC 7336]|uniref:hypothetical protein n=1 Tax=Synechococcus sp. PCC 7336 TaxID=195250 RepID=UPI0003455852|nr:hypothetical protein [Synechococcus sp. PCC 7336]